MTAAAPQGVADDSAHEHDHDHAHDHEHDGDPGHVHDEACAMAHGDLPVPTAQRSLVLVSASPVAAELADLGGRLGWSVQLLEPDATRTAALFSGALARAAAADVRFDADTDVVVCDHDRPELGDVLVDVLSRPSRWVGVMGSLRHTAPHVAALQARGVPEDDIARVHRPIGLDVGAKSPPEIAVATLAGLLADHNGRPGGLFRPPA